MYACINNLQLFINLETWPRVVLKIIVGIMSRHSRSNVGSILLSEQENESLFNILENGCVVSL